MSHAIPQHPAGVGTPRRGFTIIETMVTVAVVAILIAIAVPSMQKLIARKRVAGVAALAADHGGGGRVRRCFMDAPLQDIEIGSG